MYELQKAISINWNSVPETIDNKLIEVREEDWGETRIQSQRYEIHLNFGNDQSETGCWKDFCESHDYEKKKIETILDFARRKTRHDLGAEKLVR